MKTRFQKIHRSVQSPRFAGVLAACMTVMATTARAQTFAIDRFTIAGGGGTSTSAVYALSATIGQSDAGQMSEGNYSISGGFWSVVTAIQTPVTPLLGAERIGNGVRLSWPLAAAGFIPEQSTTLTASPSISWAQVPSPYQTNATHIFIDVPIQGGSKFYRLRKP